MKFKILFAFLLFTLSAGAQVVRISGDSAVFAKKGGAIVVQMKTLTKDSVNGVAVNTGAGVIEFKKIRAISATQFVVGTDTITITGSGGGGGSDGNDNLANGPLTADGDYTHNWASHSLTINSISTLDLNTNNGGENWVGLTANETAVTLQQFNVSTNTSTYLNLDGEDGATIGKINNTSGAFHKIRIATDRIVMHGKETDTTNIYLGNLMPVGDAGDQHLVWGSDGRIKAVSAAHTHEQSDIIDLVSDLAAKADASHSHTESDITGLVSDLAGKADAVHSHAISDVTGLITALAGKSSTGHSHTESDVTGLVSDLAGKAATVHTHAESDITNLVSDLAGKAATSHTHAQSDITGLVTALSGKAATSHTHVYSDITDLPTQTGQSGKFLTTNGTVTSWATPTVAWGSITGTITGQTDLVTLVNAKVADAINDGTTTIAPSQNAVFDALALKSAVGHTHTYADNTSFPAQSGETGKYLTTNGTTLTWGNPLTSEENFVNSMMGYAIKFNSYGTAASKITTTVALADGTTRYGVIDVKTTTTVTKVYWWQTVAGDYTADQVNGWAVYSVNTSTGDLSKVGETTNDGAIWKGTANAFYSKSFSSSIVLTPGKYAVALLYSSSAQVTAPSIGQLPAMQNNTLLFNGYLRWVSTNGAEIDFPNTVTLASTAAALTPHWFGIE